MQRFILLILAIVMSQLAGCVSSSLIAVRPEFSDYDRVAIWANLPRTDEEVFIPLYMIAFPEQEVIERRDLQSIISNDDVLPDELSKAELDEIRQLLGVQAIVYPHATETQLAIKVIDTDSGAISVSAVVSGKNYITGNASKNVDLIETLINEIKIRTRIGQRN